jgi:hypothetical protein
MRPRKTPVSKSMDQNGKLLRFFRDYARKNGLFEAVCEQRHKWQMPKVPKMPKIKVSCLFKMIAFHNFRSF